MPTIDRRSIADQIHEAFAPVQPEDCREANMDILTIALRTTGPVVHERQVVSLGKDGAVAFEPRHFDMVPASTRTDEEGHVHEVPEREPTDAEIARQWGLPLASATPLPLMPLPDPAPEIPVADATHPA